MLLNLIVDVLGNGVNTIASGGVGIGVNLNSVGTNRNMLHAGMTKSRQIKVEEKNLQ